jgi:hypothetical protein
MKTSEMTGTALDWAVTKCETGQPLDRNGPFLVAFKYSTDWAQGGPIIEREGIDVRRYEWWGPSMEVVAWSAQLYGTETPCVQTGPTPLIAAMRCFVASKLGDDIEIPEELTQGESK